MYDLAIAGYNEALAIKPNEQYPKDKILEINAIILKESASQAIDEKYNTTIIKADGAFNSKDFKTAKSLYIDALSIKPTEIHPKNQLSRIEAFITDELKNKSTQEKYTTAIAKADEALAAKDYTSALAAYKEAHNAKPSEPYPINKITEVNSAIDELSRAEIKEKQYNDLIAKADKLFALKDYKKAKSTYQDALLVKATEKYPRTKIAEISALTERKTTIAPVVKINKDDFRNELAKKYPEGITEEYATEGNAKIIRRIIVRGSQAHLYIQKTTSFGPIYYFKDEIPITEKEYLNDTEILTK